MNQDIAKSWLRCNGTLHYGKATADGGWTIWWKPPHGLAYIVKGLRSEDIYIKTYHMIKHKLFVKCVP